VTKEESLNSWKGRHHHYSRLHKFAGL
jgi:hypothetical protein